MLPASTEIGKYNARRNTRRAKSKKRFLNFQNNTEQRLNAIIVYFFLIFVHFSEISTYNNNMNNEQLIAEFARQNPTTARAIFEQAIAAEVDVERADRLRLVMEFTTNPAFASALSNHVFAITQAA